MIQEPTQQRVARRRTSSRAGYVVAAVVNLGALWLVNQLLGWGWPPFLTPEFEDLLPIIDVSLVASAVVNLCWACWDPTWFRHLGQIGLNLVSLVVAVRTWQIFPFDFSSSTWETVTRMLVGLCIFGIVIATVVEAVKLVVDEPGRSRPARGTSDGTGRRARRPSPLADAGPSRGGQG